MVDSEKCIRPVAKVLIDVGLNLTRQSVLSQLMRKPVPGENAADTEEPGNVAASDFEKMKNVYEGLLKLNSRFKGKDKFKCGRCTFTDDTACALHYHQEYAHDMEVSFYNCALCDFLSRDSSQFLDHMRMTHKRRGQIFLKPKIFLCSQCQFETNEAVIAKRHKIKCATVLRTHALQPTVIDCDFPVFSASVQLNKPTTPAKIQPKPTSHPTPPPMMRRMTLNQRTGAPSPRCPSKPHPIGPNLRFPQRISGRFTLHSNTPPTSTHKGAIAVDCLDQQNAKMIGHSNNNPVLRILDKIFVLRTITRQQYLVPVEGVSQLSNFIPLVGAVAQMPNPTVVSVPASATFESLSFQKVPKTMNERSKKRKLGSPASARSKNSVAAHEKENSGSDSVIMLGSNAITPKKRGRMHQQHSTVTTAAPASSSKPGTVIVIDSISDSDLEQQHQQAPINKTVAKRMRKHSTPKRKKVSRVNGEQIVVNLISSEEDTFHKPNDVPS